MGEPLSTRIYETIEQDSTGGADVSRLKSSRSSIQVGRALNDRFIDEADWVRILEEKADGLAVRGRRARRVGFGSLPPPLIECWSHCGIVGLAR